MPQDPEREWTIVTVAAVVPPRDRGRLEAAGSGCFSVVHRDTVGEAARVVRERPVDAVLVSVHDFAEGQVEAVGRLVRSFPGIPTVALVSRHDSTATEMVLRLGATGVRQVVDVTSPAGWAHLRQLLAEPATRAAARILAPLLEAMPDLTPDARLFLEAMVRLAPSTPAVRTVARRLGISCSTLMSRFQRADLPSPKNYLAAIRLLHVSQLLDGGGLSVCDVAYRLEYSSPQSLSRHLRVSLGITATEFRRRFSFETAMGRFLDVMIRPYLANWQGFHPLAMTAWERKARGETGEASSKR
ncbi:MAG TPA: AraC family transcriptional regulator [Actinomycetota bacterium]